MEEYLIDEYLESLRRKGKHPLTVDEYRRNLAEYAAYLAARSSSVFTVTEGSAAGYVEAVKGKGVAAKTIHKKLFAAYSFYEWLKESGRILLNPFPKPKFRVSPPLPRRVPCATALAEVYKKLRGSERLYEQRDYAMIDLAYSCGLRRCELRGLDVEDVSQDDGTIRVTGKRGKQRIVPIGKTTLDDLLYYLYHIRPKLLKNSATRALFVSWVGGGRRMQPESINAAFRRLRKQHGFDPALVPHGLRHAFALDLLRNGAPVQDVAKMLGHENLETTQVYTRLLPLDLKEHHARYHPRG